MEFQTTLLVNPQTARCAIPSVETIAKKLNRGQRAQNGLFKIYVYKKLLLRIIGYAISNSFGSTKTTYKNQTIDSITNKRMSTTFKYLIKFIQKNVTQYRTQSTALGNTLYAAGHFPLLGCVRNLYHLECAY